MRVAVPPILEIIAWLRTYFLGSNPRPLVNSIIIGIMIKTVVTLSRNADINAVTTEKRTSIFTGLPFVNSAIFTDTIENSPECFKILTMTIIPKRSMIVSKSISSMA